MNDQNDQPAPEPRRYAFFFDVDGTLAEIQPRPELVFIPPSTLAALERLHAGGIPVAVISGRPLAQLDALLAPLQLPAAGVHGAERRDATGELRNLALDNQALERIQRELQQACSEHPGLHLENKSVAFALHFRQAPELEEVARTLAEDFAQRYAEVLTLQPGKCVFELKPRGASKGEVIRAFMQEPPFAGCIPFAAVNALGGRSIKVGDGPSEARERVASVAAVGSWIEALLNEPGVPAEPRIKPD